MVGQKSFLLNQCMIAAKNAVLDSFGVKIEESTVEQVLRFGTADISKPYLDRITSRSSDMWLIFLLRFATGIQSGSDATVYRWWWRLSGQAFSTVRDESRVTIWMIFVRQPKVMNISPYESFLAGRRKP